MFHQITKLKRKLKKTNNIKEKVSVPKFVSNQELRAKEVAKQKKENKIRPKRW